MRRANVERAVNLAYAAWERRQIPSKNDEDEILNVAHQLNHAVQKKIAEATDNPKIESRHTLIWGFPYWAVFHLALLGFSSKLLLETKVLRKGEVRQPQVCDHCGGRFGLLTHRWWSNKFCKKKCKDAHLRELAFRRDQIRRWYGFLSQGVV
jgi:hypothetical protein